MVFCSALFVHFICVTANWNSGFLAGHEFRQSQTAIISYYIAEQDNFSLRYETPILGKPWVSFPLEMPLYEWSVVLLAKATGLPHFKAARSVSLACFYLSLPAFYLLLDFFRLPRERRLLVLALFLTCPVYIFYSRAFLMESMVLMFCAWFLLGFVRTLGKRSFPWLLLCNLAGAGAGLVKSTTFFVWLMPAATFAGWFLWRGRQGGWKPMLVTAGWSGAAVLIPCALVWWWIDFTDQIKAVHASAYIFTSKNLSQGNFGLLDLAARFSPKTWKNLLENWHEAIMAPWLIGVLMLGGAAFLRRQRWLILVTAAYFLAAQCLFPFAYALQDYYFYACAAFLLGAIGFVLCGVLDSPLPRWSCCLILAVPFWAQLTNYWQGYRVLQSVRSQGGSGLTEALRDLTPKGSVLVIAGADWAAIIPYNSQRKALMIRRGLEFDPAYLDRAFNDLAGENVSALVLIEQERNDTSLVRRAAAKFNLVTTPTFSHPTADVYMAKAYDEGVAFRLKDHPGYEGIKLLRKPPALPVIEDGREKIPPSLAVTAFGMISPAPAYFKSTFGYAVYREEETPVLSAHPDSDLWLTPPAQAGQIIWEYGIFAGAYEREGRKTDGVEFIITGEQPHGERREIYRRLLDPANVPADRSRQRAVIPYRPLPGEALVFSTRPNHDTNFDWAYWARIEVR